MTDVNCRVTLQSLAGKLLCWAKGQLDDMGASPLSSSGTPVSNVVHDGVVIFFACSLSDKV